MRRQSGLLALLVLLLSFCVAPSALAAGKAKEGWGPQSGYIGRYHVNVL
jgi:hypothetical protein